METQLQIFHLLVSRLLVLQNLPKGTGFLDSMVGHLPNWRKSSPSFPVLSWRQFMDMVHIQVNPLAGEEHMKELIHQLQLMGEVGPLPPLSKPGATK